VDEQSFALKLLSTESQEQQGDFFYRNDESEWNQKREEIKFH
jgi:hypothetical protein